MVKKTFSIFSFTQYHVVHQTLDGLNPYEMKSAIFVLLILPSFNGSFSEWREAQWAKVIIAK